MHQEEPSPYEKAKELIERMNNAPITMKDWQKASSYAKNDLKRKVFIILDEIDNIGCWVSNQCAEKEGLSKVCTQEYWQEVRLNVENFQVI